VPKVKKNSAPASATSANVGYEAQLWQMADALRGSMDAAIAVNLKELGYGL